MDKLPLFGPQGNINLTSAILSALMTAIPAGVAANALSFSPEVGVTASATQTQAAATMLSATAIGHSVDTVATTGDGVRLGVGALAGQVQVVSNNGANDMKLYGRTTATINGVATATGVTVPAGTTVWLYCMADGDWRAVLAVNPSSINLTGNAAIAGLLTLSGVETPIVAGTTQTQAGATVLSATKYGHSVTTVGTGGDGVRIGIAATVGAQQFVANDAAANSMQLYGLGTDTINKVATATGVAVTAAKGALLYCTVAGNWHAIIA